MILQNTKNNPLTNISISLSLKYILQHESNDSPVKL